MAGEFINTLEAMRRIHTAGMERPAKRAEFEERRLAAKRKIKLAPELDQEAKAKVDLSVEDLRIKKDWKQLDELSSNIQGTLSKINSKEAEKSWQQTKKFITQDQAERFGLDLKKDWKHNKPIGKRISDRSVHTIEQQQKLELAGVQAAAKAKTPKYKPPGQGDILSGGPLGAFQTQMLADPVFADMGKDDLAKVSQIAAMRFEDFKQVNEAENNQRAANNLPPIQFNQTNAFNKATKQTKEYLYDGIGTDWWKFGLGDPELKYMDAEEAQEREMKWKRRFIQMMAQKDPKFLAELQSNPYETETRMKAIYLKEQNIRMQQDQIKIHGSINNR